MSVAYAQVAPNPTRSIPARANAIMCPSLTRPSLKRDCDQVQSPSRLRFLIEHDLPAQTLSRSSREKQVTALADHALARDVEEPAYEALSVAHCGHFAAQPGIEAETAAGALEGKQEHQQGEEHVRPRPLG